MPQRFEQTFGEVHPDYLPDAPEVQEPARLFEPSRIPGITPDTASVASAESRQPDESVEIDLTIGVGEDPGWHRARRARQWKGAPESTVPHGT